MHSIITEELRFRKRVCEYAIIQLLIVLESSYKKRYV